MVLIIMAFQHVNVRVHALEQRFDTCWRKSFRAHCVKEVRNDEHVERPQVRDASRDGFPVFWRHDESPFGDSVA